MSEPNALPELELTNVERKDFCDKAVLEAQRRYPEAWEPSSGMDYNLGDINKYSGIIADYALRKLSAFENLAAMEIPERPKVYSAEWSGGDDSVYLQSDTDKVYDILLAKLAVAERKSKWLGDQRAIAMYKGRAEAAEQRLAGIEAAAKAELPEEPKMKPYPAHGSGFFGYCAVDEVDSFASAAKAKIFGFIAWAWMLDRWRNYPQAGKEGEK